MEPVELIKAKDGRRVLVAYSLGNFLSNQGGRSTLRITRRGVILKVELVRTELGVEVDSWDSMATWVHNRNIRIEGKRIEDVHVEVVPLMIKKLEREIMDEQDQRKKRALQKKILFYQGRIKAAEKILKRLRGDLEVSRAF